MSFEQKLREVLDGMKLTEKDRQAYTLEANEICEYFMKRMKKQDADFARCFVGVSMIGSYLDDLDVETPDEFSVVIKLQLPYEVKVSRADNPAGSIKLSLDKKAIRALKITHPFTHVSNGYSISRQKVQKWIRDILESIFSHKELSLQLSSGRIYRIEYSQYLRGYAVAHTLVCEDEKDRSRKMTFDLAPAFEFTQAQWVSDREYPLPGASWFAVPYPKSKVLSFMIWAPHLEREVLKDKNHLNKSLRLIKAIRDSNQMPHLNSCLMKAVYLCEAERHKKCEHFWEQSTGELLVYMVKSLAESLRIGNISFYWNNELNLLNRLDRSEIRDYQRKVQKVLLKLEACRSGKASLTDLNAIFGGLSTQIA